MGSNSSCLIQKIKEGDSEIISQYINQLKNGMEVYLRNTGLSRMETEEVLMDSITIFVEKVNRGAFVDRGVDPICYLKRIAYLRGLYYLNKRNRHFEEFNETFNELKKKQEPTHYLLDVTLDAIDELPTKKKKLIELTYLEGYSDREIIDHKLTDYSTIDSLKTQRYKAVKALTKIIESSM